MTNNTPWTAADWTAWRAENGRILSAGGRLWTNQKLDGTVELWAELNGKQWRRDPGWERDTDGNYVYGAP